MKSLSDVFKVFHDKELFFQETDERQSNQLIYKQLLIICLFGFIYGLTMGSYHSFSQALVAGIKVMTLFVTSLLICFPSFFIIQQIFGSKIKFKQLVIIILSGFVLSSTITLSFAPIIVFFLITGNDYHFIQLLHVGIFIFAGFFGMRLIIEALKYACEKKSIYPQIGVTGFKVWIIILAFVSIQLAWNLRPFMGDRDQNFQLFRKYEGNFYTAVIYSFEQLLSKNDKETTHNNDEDKLPSQTKNDSIYFYDFMEE